MCRTDNCVPRTGVTGRFRPPKQKLWCTAVKIRSGFNSSRKPRNRAAFTLHWLKTFLALCWPQDAQLKCPWNAVGWISPFGSNRSNCLKDNEVIIYLPYLKRRIKWNTPRPPEQKAELDPEEVLCLLSRQFLFYRKLSGFIGRMFQLIRQLIIPHLVPFYC